VLSGGRPRRVRRSPHPQVVVTENNPLPPDKRNEKITVLTVSRLLADAILRIHLDHSVSKLFEQQSEEVRMRNS